LEIEADADAVAVLHGFASPHTLIVFSQLADVGVAARFDSRLACPSVKLFAPATGAPGLRGLFGVFTAGVLASRFAGCAIATVDIPAATRAIARMRRMLLFSFGLLVTMTNAA
jgi:hypothetical protein